MFISTVALFLSVCNKKSVSVTRQSSEVVLLVIDIPEPRTDGNIYFQYVGRIDIKNNGKNGEAINIEVTLPSESITSDENTYSNTLPVILYNADETSEQQYMTRPSFNYGILELFKVKEN